MAALLEDIVRSLELWLKLRSEEPQPYVDPDLDPVLLVPGIAGSILHAVDTETGEEERIWVRILQADYKFRTKLWSRYDPSTGKTISLDPKTKIVVPEDRYGLYAIDTLDPDMVIGIESVYYFHNMIVEMLKWGFQEGRTLFGFGYDFRQSNRLQETLERFADRLESVYKAAGEKKINVVSHSMGGLLVKCFMNLHSECFEKYVKNWIAIAAPFRGAPGYIASSLINGMSFVDGWEQNFFVSKWSMHQLLIECPSIYELMVCPNFHWQHPPIIELWRERGDSNGDSHVILESYCSSESVEIFKEALSENTVNYDGENLPFPFNLEILKWADETWKILSSAKLPPQVKFYNIYGTGLATPQSVCYGTEKMPVKDLRKLRYFQPSYIFVNGDGTVPMESAKADGLDAEARVGVPGEHREILNDHRVYRMLKQWLKAGEPDPFYNPINDYVILPSAFEMEKHHEKGLEVASLKGDWEIISDNHGNLSETGEDKPAVSSISVSRAGDERAEALATLTVRRQTDGKRHVELNAISVAVDA